MSALRSAAFPAAILAVLLACPCAARGPDWVTAPPPDTGQLKHFVGVGEKPTEAAARKEALDNAIGEIAQYLGVKQSFDYVSVRDKSGREVVEVRTSKAGATVRSAFVQEWHLQPAPDGGKTCKVYVLVSFSKETILAQAEQGIRRAVRDLKACRKPKTPPEAKIRLLSSIHDGLEEAAAAEGLSAESTRSIAETKSAAGTFAASFLPEVRMVPAGPLSVRLEYRGVPLPKAPVRFHAPDADSSADAVVATDEAGTAAAPPEFAFKNRRAGTIRALVDSGFEPRAAADISLRGIFKLAFAAVESGPGSSRGHTLSGSAFSGFAAENGFSAVDLSSGAVDASALKAEAVRVGARYLLTAMIESKDCLKRGIHFCYAEGNLKLIDPADGTILEQFDERVKSNGRTRGIAGRGALQVLLERFKESLRSSAAFPTKESGRQPGSE